jgi:hypothetical protein
MDTAQVVSILISGAAFAVVAYGIFERRLGARRSERVRLTGIVENLTKVRLELLDLVAKGQTIGEVVEAVNARVIERVGGPGEHVALARIGAQPVRLGRGDCTRSPRGWDWMASAHYAGRAAGVT